MFLYGFSSSLRKRNEFDFDNFYKLHFSEKEGEENKIIMTVFILIKHYTRSMRMNWLELSRLCINAFSVFALFL